MDTLVSRWMPFPRRFRHFLLIAVIFSFAAAVIRADTTATFSRALAPANRSGAGFDRLNTGQVAALDAMIQRDIQAARAGDVVGFARSFTERRTPEERQSAGIDQLTEAERAHLDQLVAAELARRPAAAFVGNVAPTRTTGQEVDYLKPRAEVHGQVSLFYGQSSGGGSFYGGSFDAVVIDPSKRFLIGVGYSEVRGHGAPRCFDGRTW